MLLFIVQEQGGAVGFEHARRFRHDLVQHGTEIQMTGHLADEFEELHFLLAGGFHPFEKQNAAQRDGGLLRHGFEQMHVLVGEAALLLVEKLQHADDVFAEADRHAHQVAGLEIGPFIRARIEARIGVGVVDDRAGSRTEHGPRDALVVHDADFADRQALRDARVQLAGILIGQEKRAALGVGFLRADFEDGIQQLVQIVDGADLLRNPQQELHLMQVLRLALIGHSVFRAPGEVDGRFPAAA